jgi:chromosome segregation ATPase
LSLQILIIGEVFLVLLGVSAYFFYSLFSLNKQLTEKNETLKAKLSDARSRMKGLRAQIQSQNKKIKKLEAEATKKAETKQKHQQKMEQLVELKEKAQESEISAKQDLSKLKQQFDKLCSESEIQQQKLDKHTKDKDKERARQVIVQEEENFRELYYDLKNSIAYSMSGGEQALELLRNRLAENGNTEASDELGKFKERYSSVGGMVGLVDDVVIYDEEDVEIDADMKEIERAESLMQQVEDSLTSAQDMDDFDRSNLEFTQQEMDRILNRLDEVTRVKEALTSDLDKTSLQLRAFISKAHVFQAQKEQIRMHKDTEKQLHRNLANLGNDYRQLTRQFKTLEARNDILGAQLKNSSQDKESIEKLTQLRGELEETEKSMDLLRLEKEMLEQQFLMMSKEMDFEEESSETLERLEAEHELLEQQFLDLLKELENSSE